MTATAFGHPLETLHDGVSVIPGREGFSPRPVPLGATRIAVTMTGGLATVRIARQFRNEEDAPIEAILTVPVGFDAIVTGLWVEVDGRRLTGRAQPRTAARDIYETAIDEGRLAVLHEEVLRGVHMVSVGPIAPGREVVVTAEAVVPLTLAGGHPFLRLPMTVGQLYGASPLMPADDLVTAAGLRQMAELTLASGCGAVRLGDGQVLTDGGTVRVPLGAAVEIRFAQAAFGRVSGFAADGRAVRIDLHPVAGEEDRPLDLAILVDRSGSTGAALGPDGATVWSAMQAGLSGTLRTLGRRDRIHLWQFDNRCDLLGAAFGPDAADLTAKLDGPSGGTELGGAIRRMIGHGARDILVLTDGQTWAREVDGLASARCRIGAILVGSGSLDANIGHLAAMTGGQVLYAPGADVAAAIGPALSAMRTRASSAEGGTQNGRPERLSCLRGGVRIAAHWGGGAASGPCDPVGRFAAALMLPLLTPEQALALALAHDLCTHATSLVLVDAAGETTEGLPGTRKVGLCESVLRFTLADAHSLHMDRAGWMDAGRLNEYAMAEIKPFAIPFDDHDGGSLEALARSIDWEAHANDFLAGDLAALSEGQAMLLDRILASPTVIRLAAESGMPVPVMGVAMIAAALEGSNRAAARFVRRVLGNRDAETLRHLLLAAEAGE